MRDLSGAGANVVRFPGADRPHLTDLELVHGAAPWRSLVAGLLDDVGLPHRDVAPGLTAEIGYVMSCFERGYGTEAAVLRFRELVDAETARAAGLIRTFNATAEVLMVLERAVARSDRVSGMDRMRLRRMRETFRGQAIAARAAADAALAAAKGMVSFVREGSVPLPDVASEPQQLSLFAAG